MYEEKTNRSITCSTLSVSTQWKAQLLWVRNFSGEETVETMDPSSAEEVVPEIAETENEEAAEGIWISEEEEEFGTDEIPEVDEFTSEDTEELTDAAGAEQGTGSYELAYITEEQYNHCLQSEDVRK